MIKPLLIWSELKKKINAADADGYVSLRVEPDSSCDIFLAVNIPGQRFSLLLEVDSKDVPYDISFPDFRFLEIFPQIIKPGPNGQIRIILRLSNQIYAEVFSSLIEDLVSQVSSQANANMAVQVFIVRLKMWQAILSKIGPEGLSERAQQGLFAELWFLKKYAIPNSGILKSASAWVGPEKSEHDFRFPECGVEVKSSMQSTEEIIHISNLQQLDDTGIYLLLLFHVTLEIQPDATYSLPDFIKSLREDMAGDNLALTQFNKRLLEAGYLEDQAYKYEGTRYNVIKCSFFKICPEFPRIISNDIKKGILAAQYIVDTSFCKSFRISNGEVQQILTGE